jgi:hypothetical protein
VRGNEIRAKFLEYFAANGHELIPTRPRSLSDLSVRSEGKFDLRQILCKFAANSGAIQQEFAQNITRFGFSAVGQS